MMTDLKPCPFCGRTPAIEDCGNNRYFVRCKCGIAQDKLYGQRCDAVRRWNTRKGEQKKGAIKIHVPIDAITLEDLKKKMADSSLLVYPPEHLDIIMCKDCKWKQGSECVRFADIRPFPDDYCSRAEKEKKQ